MRLQAIFNNLSNILSQSELEIENSNNSNGNMYLVKNWITIRSLLYQMEQYNFLIDNVHAIYQIGANFSSSYQPLAIHPNQYKAFVTKYNMLISNCENVVNFISELDIMEDEVENDLCIKLPSIDDIDEFSNITEDLSKAFGQCPLFRDYPKIGFKRVDIGSNWIILVAETIGFLMLIAKFIRLCININKDYNEAKKANFEAQIAELKLKDEQKKEILEKYHQNEKQKIKDIIIQKTSEMDEAKDIKLTPDDETKLVYSACSLAKLIEKGMEFYPNIDASQDIKDLFPKQEVYLKITGDIKLLSEEKEDKGEQSGQ